MFANYKGAIIYDKGYEGDKHSNHYVFIIKKEKITNSNIKTFKKIYVLKFDFDKYQIGDTIK